MGLTVFRAGQFHPPGERQAVTGIFADDAGDGICLEIDEAAGARDDGKPGGLLIQVARTELLSPIGS